MNGDTKLALWITLAFLALHLVLSALIPLIGDETYYTLWSSGLDWDYYDHPPMIAWMIRAGTTLWGNTPFGVRFVPLLAMAAASLCVADMAAQGSRSRAVLYFNLGLLVLGVGSFATPDAPSTLFWLASTAAALRATGGQGNRWWLIAGLAAGLGIMSKFTNLFLGIGYVGWLLATRPGRASLRKPGPYIALLAAALPVLPLILWNMSHDNLGYARQFGRITEGALTARHLLEYAALMFALPGPVIALLALRALPQAKPLLLWSAAPLLIYFAIHALHAQVQANWLIPVSGTVALLAAQTPRWQRMATLTTAALSFPLLAAAFNPWTALGTADNPPNQTRGWPDFLSQLPPDGWIATTDYALTGQLYTLLPTRPVWSVDDLQRYGFRGPFPADLCTTPGWLVEEASANKNHAATLFTTLGPEQRLTRTFAGKTLKSYRIRAVIGPKDPKLCP